MLVVCFLLFTLYSAFGLLAVVLGSDKYLSCVIASFLARNKRPAVFRPRVTGQPCLLACLNSSCSNFQHMNSTNQHTRQGTTHNRTTTRIGIIPSQRRTEQSTILVEPQTYTIQLLSKNGKYKFMAVRGQQGCRSFAFRKPKMNLIPHN